MNFSSILNKEMLNKEFYGYKVQTIGIAFIGILALTICLYFYLSSKNKTVNNDVVNKNDSSNNQQITTQTQDNTLSNNILPSDSQENFSEQNNVQMNINEAQQGNNMRAEKGDVFMHISLDDKPLGSVLCRLYDNTPKTNKNFRDLAQSGKYNNVMFHRVIKDFMIQGGDYENNDGTGGESIYGKTFEDENFDRKHDKPYLLSMANAGPNTNGSQFFVTTKEMPHLDNKHVVFGEVIDGKEVIDEIQNLQTDGQDKPVNKVMIHQAGVLE